MSNISFIEFKGQDKSIKGRSNRWLLMQGEPSKIGGGKQRIQSFGKNIEQTAKLYCINKLCIYRGWTNY